MRTSIRTKLSVLFIALVIGLVAFSPDLQSVTRIPGTLQVRGKAILQDTLAVTGASTLTGATTVSGALDVDGATTVDAFTAAEASTFSSDSTVVGVTAWDDTDSSVVGTQTITPTYSYLQVSPATVLTATLSTGSAADGDLLIIHNLVSTSTTIVDTGATQGGGVVTLGQDDIAIFIYGDGVWVEIASPDNS